MSFLCVSGTLNLAVGGTSSGVFNIAASAALSSNGGIHNMNSGATVQGAGTLQVQGGAAFNFNPGSSLTSATALAGVASLNLKHRRRGDPALVLASRRHTERNRHTRRDGGR